MERRSVSVHSASDKVTNHSQGSRNSEPTEATEKQNVPALRSDLKLQPLTVDSTGTPNWILGDTLRTRYFKLGWVEYELLSRWHLEQPEQIVASANRETTLSVSPDDISKLVEFLENNELTVANNAKALNNLLAKSERKSTALWRRGFRSTMFVRKRLYNPDKLLSVLVSLLSPIFEKSTLFIIAWLCAAITAAIGVSAHAYEFKDAFSAFMTPGGLALFALTLLLLNVLHEIGHAMVAKRFGCRVSEIGVALIFMLPVAYCDTSDAWRLTSRKKRLLVNAGGIAAELVVAVLALLAWLVLPDGIPRTIAYFIAITSAISTLLINLNPCLKFDGYYLLSDWLGVENLQRKSFDLGRWQWRKRILGDLEPIPHPVTQRELTVLYRYAIFTWAYRFFLYLSICAMVYQFWFKALGITLMIGVCIAMLLKPLASELWHYIRTIASGQVSGARVGSLITVLAFSALFFIPLPRSISIPAVISADTAGRVFNHTAGFVTAVNVETGQEIKAGDVLVQLRVPELDYREATLRLEIEKFEYQLNRKTQWNKQQPHTEVSQAHIRSKQAELDQVIHEKERMALRAPYDAIAVAVPEWLQPGLWLSANTILAEFVSNEEPEIRAYLPANKLAYIDSGTASFETHAGTDFNNLLLTSISDANINVLTDTILSTQLGGVIATQQLPDGELEPLQGWHMVSFSLGEYARPLPQELAGFTKLAMEPHSFASSVFRRVYGVVLRESGF